MYSGTHGPTSDAPFYTPVSFCVSRCAPSWRGSRACRRAHHVGAGTIEGRQHADRSPPVAKGCCGRKRPPGLVGPRSRNAWCLCESVHRWVRRTGASLARPARFVDPGGKSERRRAVAWCDVGPQRSVARRGHVRGGSHGRGADRVGAHLARGLGIAVRARSSIGSGRRARIVAVAPTRREHCRFVSQGERGRGHIVAEQGSSEEAGGVVGRTRQFARAESSAGRDLHADCRCRLQVRSCHQVIIPAVGFDACSNVQHRPARRARRPSARHGCARHHARSTRA